MLFNQALSMIDEVETHPGKFSDAAVIEAAKTILRSDTRDAVAFGKARDALARIRERMWHAEKLKAHRDAANPDPKH